MSYKVLAMVAAILFIAILPLPYGYYTFMRFIVCGCAAYIAYQKYKLGEKNIWLWIFGFIAILFNPIAPIHMTKEIWMAVDAMAGGLFGYMAFYKYRNK